MTSPAQVARRGTRLRLSPDVRIPQILDAALALFAERGFAAARMDDLAQRCELSKGGLYAHFASKDEVLEALLQRALAAPALTPPREPLPLSPTQLADWLIEQLYDRLQDPQTQAALRLLVAESERVPHLVAQWHQRVVQPYVDALGRLMQQTLAASGRRDPLLAQEPWMALSPALQALLMELLLPDLRPRPLERARAAHRALLLRLLGA